VQQKDQVYSEAATDPTDRHNERMSSVTPALLCFALLVVHEDASSISFMFSFVFFSFFSGLSLPFTLEIFEIQQQREKRIMM